MYSLILIFKLFLIEISVSKQCRPVWSGSTLFAYIGPENGTLNANGLSVPFIIVITSFRHFVTYRLCMPGTVARLYARPSGMQTWYVVAGSILTSGNILSWRLVMK